VQVLGVAVVSLGFGLLATWAGVVAGGFGLVILGVAAEMGGTYESDERQRNDGAA
jgi:hypothetical protein